MRWLVVGGGAAGCAVAARLAERSDRRADVAVTLLEAGPASAAPTAVDDVGPQPRSASTWGWSAAHRDGDPALPYAQGRGLGGSSLINAGIVVGEPPAELKGRLPLERPWSVGPVGEALMATEPAARLVSLVRRGARRVTAAELFAPILDGGAVTTICDSPVERILFDGRRAVGVVTTEGDRFDADAIVVCAGAIGTPALLLRSGVDTPGVGVGLQDHPAVAVAVEVPEGRFDPGAPTVAVTAERSAHQLLALNHVGPEPPLGAVMAVLLRVTSAGSVTLPDPEGPPIVTLGELATPDDRDGMLGAAHDLLAVVGDAAFRERFGGLYLDAHGTRLDRTLSPDEVSSWLARSDLAGCFHVAASCRRGVVTDADGWVRGYESLAVGDASLFPTVPTRNPYLETVAQGWRLVTPRFVERPG